MGEERKLELYIGIPMRNRQFILLLIASVLCLTFGFGTGYLVHAYFPLSGANFPILIEAHPIG